jgi:hypothetical protein
MARWGGRWKWRAAGGAAILLFGALLVVRLGIPEGVLSPSGGGAPAIQGDLPAGETWMAITQGGRKIGHAHRSIAKTEKGFRLTEEVFMRINTMGIVQPLTVRTEAELKPDRTLASFRFDLGSSLFRFRAEGTVAGKEMTVRIGGPGEEKSSVIALAEAPYLGGGIMESIGAGLQAGEGRRFPIFDPASLGQREATVTLIGEETIVVGGQSRPARKLSVDFMGMKQTAWIDRDGGVLREEGIMGIALERVGKAEALAGLEGGVSADLTEIASIPASRPIGDPEALTGLKVRLKGFAEGPFSLDGGRQSYREGRLTIRREAAAASSTRPGGAGGEVAAFLKATPFIQSDHPKIRQALVAIVAPGDPEGVKAEKLVAWVHRNLEKRPVLSVPNALETLENRVGDCNEHAVLLAALARAAGIPAEVEAGLVYLRGRFYYHAWNVLYLPDRGGWVTADAVLGQMPADVTHIRFVRGEADRQLDLAGLIGRLQLDILETER